MRVPAARRHHLPGDAPEPRNAARRPRRRSGARTRLREPRLPARCRRADPAAVQRQTLDRVPTGVPWLAAGAADARPAVSQSSSSSMRRRRSPPVTARARSAAARTTFGSARSGAGSILAKQAPTRSTRGSTPSASARTGRSGGCTKPRAAALPDGAFVLHAGRAVRRLRGRAAALDAGRVRGARAAARRSGRADHAALARCRATQRLEARRAALPSFGQDGSAPRRKSVRPGDVRPYQLRVTKLLSRMMFRPPQ